MVDGGGLVVLLWGCHLLLNSWSSRVEFISEGCIGWHLVRNMKECRSLYRGLIPSFPTGHTSQLSSKCVNTLEPSGVCRRKRTFLNTQKNMSRGFEDLTPNAQQFMKIVLGRKVYPFQTCLRNGLYF